MIVVTVPLGHAQMAVKAAKAVVFCSCGVEDGPFVALLHSFHSPISVKKSLDFKRLAHCWWSVVSGGLASNPSQR